MYVSTLARAPHHGGSPKGESIRWSRRFYMKTPVAICSKIYLCLWRARRRNREKNSARHVLQIPIYFGNNYTWKETRPPPSHWAKYHTHLIFFLCLLPSSKRWEAPFVNWIKKSHKKRNRETVEGDAGKRFLVNSRGFSLGVRSIWIRGVV
jgi:hypothetical protein